MSEVRTLRPGLLVSLHTSIKGNIHYRKVDVEGRHVNDDGAERASWNTTRTITDPAEHKAAVEVRSRVSYMIKSVCATSAFGLLCPEDDADKLTEAIREARVLADEFNANASMTRVSVNAIYGRIAQDDVAATKAIAEEIRTLMDDMANGLQTLNAKAVSDAALSMTSIGQMLSEDAKDRMDVAITAGRKAARVIRKMAKAGETAAIEIDRRALAQIDMARTSFLDLDIEATEVAAPVVEGRTLDLDVTRTADRDRRAS